MTNPMPEPSPYSQPELTALFQAIAAMGPFNGNLAGRLLILGPDGAAIGDIRLDAARIDALTIAATSIGGLADCTEENTRPELAPLPAPTVDIDPVLENELEEYFIGLNADDLMAKPIDEAVAAFDLITSDQDDEL